MMAGERRFGKIENQKNRRQADGNPYKEKAQAAPAYGEKAGGKEKGGEYIRNRKKKKATFRYQGKAYRVRQVGQGP